jgi:CBS domain-containing protein
MRARDVMVRAVVTASPDTTVEALARLMINLRISGVPVMDKDGRLVGMVTEGDLLRRVETGTERHRSRWSEPFSSNSRLAAEYIKSHAKRVADIMTREVVSVEELATLGESPICWRPSTSNACRSCMTVKLSALSAAPTF